MTIADKLLEKVDQYQRNWLSLDAFADWFEGRSSVARANPILSEMYEAVESAFAAYHFDHIGEMAFREELAAAIAPFGPYEN